VNHTNSSENVVNTGFVKKGELIERTQHQQEQIGETFERQYGVNYRLIDYLGVASQSSRQLRMDGDIDCVRYYHGGAISVLYAGNTTPQSPIGEHDPSDVLAQI
jgi:hypothetical protein